MDKNETISSRQIAWILSMNLIAAGIFNLPDMLKMESAGTMACAGIFVMIMVMLYYSLSFSYKGTHMHGRWISGFFLIWYLTGMLEGMKQLEHVMQSGFQRPQPFGLTAFLIMLAVIYIACGSMAVRARTAEMIGWFVLIPALVFVVAGIFQAPAVVWQADRFQFQQVITSGWKSSLFFFAADVPGLLAEYGNKHEKKGRHWFVFVAAGFVVWFMLMLGACLLTDPARAASDSVSLLVMQLVTFPGNFVSRCDIFGMIVWLAADVIFMGGMLFYSTRSALLLLRKEMTPENIRRTAVILGGILYLLSLLMAQTDSWILFNWQLEAAAGVPVLIAIEIIWVIQQLKVGDNQ